MAAAEAGDIRPLAEGLEAGEGIAQGIGLFVAGLAGFVRGLAELGEGGGIDEIGPELVGDELEAHAEGGEIAPAADPLEVALVDLAGGGEAGEGLGEGLGRGVAQRLHGAQGPEAFAGQLGDHVEALHEIGLEGGDEDGAAFAEGDEFVVPAGLLIGFASAASGGDIQRPAEGGGEVFGGGGDFLIGEAIDAGGALGLEVGVLEGDDGAAIAGAAGLAVGDRLVFGAIEGIWGIGAGGGEASLGHGAVELVGPGEGGLGGGKGFQPSREIGAGGFAEADALFLRSPAEIALGLAVAFADLAAEDAVASAAREGIVGAIATIDRVTRFQRGLLPGLARDDIGEGGIERAAHGLGFAQFLRDLGQDGYREYKQAE